MWFADPSQFTFVFKNAIYSFQTVLGDGVVVSIRLSSFDSCSSSPTVFQIYRCYMVWQSIYIVIFPLIMLTGVAGEQDIHARSF